MIFFNLNNATNENVDSFTFCNSMFVDEAVMSRCFAICVWETFLTPYFTFIVFLSYITKDIDHRSSLQLTPSFTYLQSEGRSLDSF